MDAASKPHTTTSPGASLISTIELENAKNEINSLKVLCLRQTEEINALKYKVTKPGSTLDQDVFAKTQANTFMRETLPLPIDESFYSFQPNKSTCFEQTQAYSQVPERDVIDES